MTENISTHTGSSLWSIAVVNAGLGDPSSTRMLADRAATALQVGANEGEIVGITNITLRELAVDIAHATVSGAISPALKAALDAVARSDGAILATPIYKATFSGLFKSFIDLLDNDALLARPVLLAATGGSPRHALAVDMALRPLAGYLRAMVVPSALYAAPDDWSTSGSLGLGSRVERAAGEMLALLRGAVSTSIMNTSQHSYQRTLSLDPDADDEIVLDPSMLRAATGGSLLG